MKRCWFFGLEKRSLVGCIFEGFYGVERDLFGLGVGEVKSSGGNYRNSYFDIELELV